MEGWKEGVGENDDGGPETSSREVTGKELLAVFGEYSRT
jgi:hypothetical protein